MYCALAHSVMLLRVAPVPVHPYIETDVPELCRNGSSSENIKTGVAAHDLASNVN
jgi:hypothetical protein